MTTRTDQSARAVGQPLEPDAAALAEIRQLYDEGQFLAASSRASECGDPVRWQTCDARVLGGRLLGQTGAPQKGARLIYATWRRNREDPPARFYAMWSLRHYRGPLLTRLAMLENGPSEWSTTGDETDWLALESAVLGDLRDFDRAERSIERALEMERDQAWLWVERSSLHEKEDQLSKALEASERALELRPWFHPAVLLHAHLLTLVDRQVDAAMFLESSLQHIQSSRVCAFLATIYTELKMFDDALNAWSLFERFAPAMEQQQKQSYAASLSDLYYLAGKLAESKRWAESAEDPMLDRIARRLATGGNGRVRKEIAVPFIRQHHVTCAPTTLSMIGRHWSRDADHLAVAEEITYNGTPTHLERDWADRNGWVTREFTLGWDGAVALIDRELPFTLTTYFPGGGHEQAIVGYDTLRRTLLVRDPGSPTIADYDMESLLETQRATGPRCMLLIPSDEVNRIDGIELEDAWERDRVFEMQKALDDHDRTRAEQELRTLLQRSPEGVPAFEGKRMMAMYDRNLAGLARVYERQLEKMPDDRLLLYWKLPVVAELHGRAAEKEVLEKLVSAEDPEAEALLSLSLILESEAGQEKRADRLLERQLRQMPGDSRSISRLAFRKWQKGDRELGAELFRLAWTVAEMDEAMASQFFMASVLTGRREEALRILTERFERDGAKAAWPAMTLHNALLESHRTDEAREVLRRALEMRPEDGDLILFAADAEARQGRWDEAEALLERASGKAHERIVGSTRASIARYRGRLKEALDEWRRILDREPLTPEVWQSVSELTLQVEGPRAAVSMIEAMIERFPHHIPFRRALVDLVREGDREIRQRALHELLKIEPTDTWALRERAILLAESNRFDDALDELEKAERIEGRDISTSSLRGRILENLGRVSDAARAFEDALADSIAEPYAVYGLLTLPGSLDERRARAETLLRRMIETEASSDAISAWYEASRELFSWDDMAGHLASIRAAHPHQWSAGALLISHWVTHGQPGEAARFASNFVERFPFVPSVWLRAADAYGANGDEDAQRRALETLMELDPTASEAVVSLTDLMLSRGEIEDAKQLLEEAAMRSPLDPLIPYNLARVAWMSEQWEEAFEHFTRALILSPHFEDAWSGARAAAMRMEQPGRLTEIADEIESQRPGDPSIPIARARSEDDPEQRVAILRDAITRDPWLHDGYQMIAEELAALGRHEEAISLLESFGAGELGNLPVGIRGRIAWLRAGSGDLEGAIAALNRLLEESPDYRWGIEILADMYAAIGDPANYRKNAVRLTKLEPNDVRSWNRLADAELMAENTAGAEKALERAIRCEPLDRWAAAVLFDLALDRGRLEVATRALEAIERQKEPGEAEWRRVKLALHSGDASGALEIIEELASGEGHGLAACGPIAREAGLDREVLSILDARVASGHASPVVAAEWATLMVQSKRVKHVEAFINQLDPRSEIFVETTRACLEAVVRLPRYAGPLRRIRRRFRDVLHATGTLWGTLLWCYVGVGSHRKAVDWAGQWQKRTDLEPWILNNISLAHRYLGSDRQAIEATEVAMQLEPDHSLPWHTIWRAWDIASIAPAEARSLIFSTDPSQTGELQNAMVHLTLAVIDAIENGAADREAVEAHLADAYRIYRSTSPPDTLLTRMFSVALGRISDVEGFSSLTWKWRLKIFLPW